MTPSSAFARVLCFTCLLGSASAELVISEVMARGGHQFKDEDGDDGDWIELFNRGSSELALGDYALTDDESDLSKWKFPARSLKAGQFLTVFASGKDRREEEGALHTSFKLDGDGEYLAVVKIASKKIVSAFDPVFPTSGKGESFGYEFKDDKILDEKVVFFKDPTPGEINGKGWLPADGSITGEDLTLDDIFPADHVLDVQITVSPKDWDTIRKQTRNILEVLGEARKEAPIEGPYTYVDASVTIDGHRFPNVGVRKKGFIGSQSDTRPSLKVKLNHVDKDGGIEGLTNLTLNNNKQDATLVNQYMGYALFNAAGAPAPRCAFAKVTVNGVNLGVYSHVESLRKPLIKRAFGNDRGTLYEGTVVDFREGWEGSFEKKFGKDKRGRAMIVKLIEVLEGDLVDEDPEKHIGKLVHLKSFYAYWAMEGLIGFWDGYSGNHNNYFTYFNPKTRKFHFLPWGADAVFDKYSELGYDEEAPISVKTKGMVAHKLYQSESGRKRYAKTLKRLLKKQWNEDALLAETDRLEELLKPHLAPIQNNFPEKLEEVREFIRVRRADLIAEIADGMPVWSKVPEHPPLLPAFAVDPDSIWNSAKTGNLEGIKAKLAEGVEVDARDPFGSVPLSLAALTGQVEAVKFLLEKGADVNAGNKENNTAMHSAAFTGQLEVMKVLAEHKADLNVRNDKGETPLDVASGPWTEELQGMIQFVGGLLQTQFDLEKVQAGRPRVATLLSEAGARKGADLPQVTTGKNIWESVKSGDLVTLRKQLAAEGADPDKQDSNGITPLSWAALTGQRKSAELLLSEGANINAKNRDGASALHSAAFLGHLEIVEFLLENKIEINATNQRGETGLNTVNDPWNGQIEGLLKLIAGFLKIEVDLEAVKANRPKIAELLRKHGGKTSAELK